MADACGAGWQWQRVLLSLMLATELLLCVHADLRLRQEGRPQWRCARQAWSAASASAGARAAPRACSSAASRACRSRYRELPRLDRGRSQPDRAPAAHSTAAVWVLAPADPPSNSDGCAESRTKPHADDFRSLGRPKKYKDCTRSAARTIERNTLGSRAAGAPKSDTGAFASVRGGRNGEIDLALAGGGAARLEYAVTLPRCS